MQKQAQMLMGFCVLAALALSFTLRASAGPPLPPAKSGFTPAQRAKLQSTVARTWSFSSPDVAPPTSLPRTASPTSSPANPHGFYDSLNPVTGSVGHRYLVLDQTTIPAALDEVLGPDGGLRHR